MIITHKTIKQHLTPYTRILVTGPQRAGTQITARIIAHELNYQFLTHLQCPASGTGIATFLAGPENIVLHHPGYAAFCHVLERDDTAIVWVNRDLHHIHASEKRIGWGDTEKRHERARLLVTRGDPASIKQALWPRIRGYLHHPFEVNYPIGIQFHPLYLPKKQRANFAPTQWQ